MAAPFNTQHNTANISEVWQNDQMTQHRFAEANTPALQFCASLVAQNLQLKDSLARMASVERKAYGTGQFQLGTINPYLQRRPAEFFPPQYVKPDEKIDPVIFTRGKTTEF